jgi:hypothetical protein
MTQVSMLHNTTEDSMGRKTGFSFGYRPGDTLREVFRFHVSESADDWREVAELAFEVGNIDPGMAADPRVHEYREARVRSVSVGDVIQVGDTFVAVGRVGWSVVEVKAGWVRHLEPARRI